MTNGFAKNNNNEHDKEKRDGGNSSNAQPYAAEIVLQAHNIHLTLENKKILDDISFALHKKETFVFMGKNGSGKTILLKTLISIFTPQQGHSLLLGQNIHGMDAADRQLLLKRVGYVFQKSGLFDSFTVGENVIFSLRRFEKKSADALRTIAVDCLRRSGLVDVEDKLPSELSGGMQKRAGIARAIAMNPDLLIMDDPTAGLDPVLTDAIADLVLELKNSLQSSALITTHNLSLAYKLADKIGLLVDGRLMALVSAKEFRTSDNPYIHQFREGLLQGPIAVVE